MATNATAIGNDGASEHVLLTLDDLQELRRGGQPNAQTLHDEARHWTNHFAQTDYEAVGVQADVVSTFRSCRDYHLVRGVDDAF